MATLEQTLKLNHDWVLKRVHDLVDEEYEGDAYSLVQEFREWLDMEKDDHDIFSLEYIGDGSEYDWEIYCIINHTIRRVC